MPNYEYECTQCAHRFEIWQSVGEAAPACEQCQSEVKKVFHVPRVIFKGSGFYVTDLRAEKGGSSNGASSSSTSAANASTSSATSSPATETKSPSPKAEGSKAESTKVESAAPAAPTATK